MISTATFRSHILHPGLERLYHLGGPRPSDAAERLLLAIAAQESGLRHRYQVLSSGSAGPARGWWQFEAGGVAGVMRHPATATLARALCDHAWVAWDQSAIWRALEGHDELAVGLARLLVWSDPAPLPDRAPAGWSYYLRTWRPGKPHPETWWAHWERAATAVGAPHA